MKKFCPDESSDSSCCSASKRRTWETKIRSALKRIHRVADRDILCRPSALGLPLQFLHGLRQPKSVRLRLTGYGFFDAFHYTSKYDPAKPGKCKFTKAQKLKRGNGHGTCPVGTLWELHPVWRLQAIGAE